MSDGAISRRDLERIARDLGTTSHDVQQAAAGRPPAPATDRVLQRVEWLMFLVAVAD